jgi:hypothetical protein
MVRPLENGRGDAKGGQGTSRQDVRAKKTENRSAVTISSSIGVKHPPQETWNRKAGRAMDADEVNDQASFLAFLAAMRSDFAEGAIAWESAKLGSFLGAMGAWAASSRPPAQANPWRHADHLLHAGAFYE